MKTMLIVLLFLASGQMFAQDNREWRVDPETGRNVFVPPAIRLRPVSAVRRTHPASAINPADLPAPAPVFGTWEETARFLRGKRIWIGQPKPSDLVRKHLSLWAVQYYGRYGGLGFGYYGGYHPYGRQVGTYSDFDPFLSLGSHLQQFLGARLQQWGLNTTVDFRAAQYRLEGEFLTFDEVRTSKGFFIPFIVSVDNGREKFRMNLFLRLVEARSGDVIFRPDGLGELDAKKYKELNTLFYSSSTRRETNAGPLAQQMVLAAIPSPPEPPQTQVELAELKKKVAQAQDEAAYLEERAALEAQLTEARRKAEVLEAKRQQQ